jgi:hypothetical protein
MPINVKFVWSDLFASGLFAKKKIGVCVCVCQERCLPVFRATFLCFPPFSLTDLP